MKKRTKIKAAISTAVTVAGLSVTYAWPQHAEITLSVTAALAAGGWIKKPVPRSVRLRKGKRPLP